MKILRLFLEKKEKKSYSQFEVNISKNPFPTSSVLAYKYYRNCHERGIWYVMWIELILVNFAQYETQFFFKCYFTSKKKHVYKFLLKWLKIPNKEREKNSKIT